MIKFLPYVLRSAYRNRLRTLLTVMGVAVAVFLITWLAAILDSRTRTVEAASPAITGSRVSNQWATSKSTAWRRGAGRSAALSP